MGKNILSVFLSWFFMIFKFLSEYILLCELLQHKNGYSSLKNWNTIKNQSTGNFLTFKSNNRLINLS